MIGALPYSLFAQDLLSDYWSGTLSRLGPLSLFLLTFLSSFACVVIGHGMLKGKSWARVSALAYCVVGTLTGALLLWGQALFWLNAITSIVFTVFVWTLLYRRDVGEYLRATGALGSGGTPQPRDIGAP
jgi:hypothetical protein